jgi:hypothetical protein
MGNCLVNCMFSPQDSHDRDSGEVEQEPHLYLPAPQRGVIK